MKMNRRQFIRTAGGIIALPGIVPSVSGVPSSLPKVLIVGDSISIGYTPFVKDLLANEAEVVRPDENCQGTKHGIKNIMKWIGTDKWDVIHFNFGLHDLKHVDPVTGKNSNRPEDPQQADLATYAKNLRTITKQLRSSGARLIFATTTPFPDKPDGPLRRAEDVPRYNRSALKIMKRNSVAVNDLYSFTLPNLSVLQIPNNVHFTKDGSLALARRVVESIQQILKN